MTDFAEPLTIPRPRVRGADKLFALINTIAPYAAAVGLGFVLGIGQGFLQANNHWTTKIVERSHADEYGNPLSILDKPGKRYYSIEQTIPEIQCQK